MTNNFVMESRFMPLNPNALTTFSFAKSYLKIPSAENSLDAMVVFWINAASGYLESATDRKLKAQTITEYLHGKKSNIVLPKEYPINSISSLHIDQESKFTNPTDLVDSSEYAIVDDSTGIMLINRLFPLGYRNIKLVYNAGFTSIPTDLENSCLWLITYYHRIWQSGDIGRTSKSKGDESVSILQNAPQDILDCIDRYKRCEIPILSRDIRNE